LRGKIIHQADSSQGPDPSFLGMLIFEIEGHGLAVVSQGNSAGHF